MAGDGSDTGDDRDHLDDRVVLGLALLERLEHESLPLPDVVDRIETVTTDPAVTRTILDEAELRGIIDREDGIIRPKSRQYVRFGQDVVTKEGSLPADAVARVCRQGTSSTSRRANSARSGRRVSGK